LQLFADAAERASPCALQFADVGFQASQRIVQGPHHAFDSGVLLSQVAGHLRARGVEGATRGFEKRSLVRSQSRIRQRLESFVELGRGGVGEFSGGV
jgi:hypothetical protein